MFQLILIGGFCGFDRKNVVRQLLVEAPDEGKPSKNEFWWSESTRNFLCIVV